MQIIKVETKRQLKQFVQFGIDLYKDCQYACPPLLLDEFNSLEREKNPAFEACDAIYFLAVNDSGAVVGRIAGIINYRANLHWNNKKIRFGWFDFIDDLSVSKALLDAVATWGRGKGMTQLNGPVGFSDMDKEGLLVEGFESSQLMASSYNFSYYEKHYDAYGLTMENLWRERKVSVPDAVPERMARVSEIAIERCNLRVLKVSSASDVKKQIGYRFFDLIDDCYSNLYNYAPLTQRQKIYYSNIYFPVLNYDFVTLVVNENSELVAAGVAMPNMSNVLRKTKGKLLPFGWVQFLKALHSKKIDEVDLLLIAVRPDYQGKGLNAIMFAHQIPNMIKHGVRFANVTNVLEDNVKSSSNFDFFEQQYLKVRKAYVKSI